MKSEQKSLGMIKSTKHSGKATSGKRCTKTGKKYKLLKPNISAKSNPKTKMNAYAGYIVPTISYASQFLPANKNINERARKN